MKVFGKRSGIAEEGYAEELDKYCEVCKVGHVTTKAYGICLECEQYMCVPCFTTHIKIKLCRQHVLVDTDQYVIPIQRSAEKIAKCKRHPNETIKFYCRKHETVGCCECMIPEHSLCQPENNKDPAKGSQQKIGFKRLMRQLEIIMSANKENGKTVQECQRENDNMLVNTLKEISAVRAEINNFLDGAESRIIKQEKYIERENNQLLTKLAQDCTLLSDRITAVRQKLDVEMYQDNALFIQTVDCKPCILDIERDVARIKSETNIRTFEFIADKHLHEMVTLIEKLGSLGKNESKSRKNPDSTRLTNEIPREYFAGPVKHTEPVWQEKENVA